jgi:alkylhydroperoxidase family enzyme
MGATCVEQQATRRISLTRIRPLTKAEADPRIAPLFDEAVTPAGETRLPVTIQAYCPPILEASRALSAAPARSGTLPALIRSLVCLRAAQIVGCLF